MGQLDGKVVVITGSTRGLGFAIAQACAREGASVVLAGRTAEVVERAVASLKETYTQVAGIATDVGDLIQVQRLGTYAIEKFGSIDVWFNNAGVGGVYGPTVDIDPQNFERLVKTNIFGTYNGSMVALHYFKEHNPHGKLINLMGRGDDKPVAYQNGYAPSKAWVRSFTLALAKENAKTGISINAFNPGLVNTDLLRKIDAVEGYEQKLKAFSVIIRLFGNGPGVPAERALWLASSATDGKTGLEVRVLGLRQQLQGAGRELARLMLRRPAPDTSLDITVLAAYKMATGETSAGQADQENQLGTQNTASSTQNNVDIHQVL